METDTTPLRLKRFNLTMTVPAFTALKNYQQAMEARDGRPYTMGHALSEMLESHPGMAGRFLCPKWEGCNAPTCPLAPKFGLDSQTGRGEPTCLWLREGMKPGGFDSMPPEIASTVREALPVLLEQGGSYLRFKLKEAAKRGSKRARFIPAAMIG